MHILMIQPKMQRRPMDSDLKSRMSPSLSLLTLAQLTPKQHQITIINENTQKLNSNVSVDLVAITVTVDVFDHAVAIAKKFRARGIPVVAGGTHITAVPEQAIPYFDAICIGMAERVWAKMLNDTQGNKLQQIYCDMDNIMGKEIASPAYDAIDHKRYLYTNIVTTSRYCSFKCDFCYNSCANTPHRHINRSIGDVMHDIKTLGTNHIMFVDDNFIGNIAWTTAFLEHLKSMRLHWNAAVSANIVHHPDLLDLMQQSGCQSLFIGFETINPQSLKSMHKTQNNTDLYEKLVHEIHSRSIMINASLVFGLPEDTNETFEATLNWMVTHKIETVTAHILTPYPGTALHHRMQQAGLIDNSDLSLYTTSHVVFQHGHMTKQQLYHGYVRFYKKLYSFRNIIRRLPDSQKQRIPFLLFNLFYRKYGRITTVISKIVPLHLLGKWAAQLAYHTK